ncbi:hypothetical protein KP509_1Z201600 [Ceratopteris richardii]|nr:hypothetical protein KP509_1Z201600 [Ceratopteris richardii]
MVIDMYAKCGSIDEAHKVFETSSNLNVISWNSMIAGLVQRQDNTRAFALFLKMEKAGIQPSKYTFSCVLNVCNHVNQGMQIHHQIITSRLESDVVVGTALVAMYANCRRVVEAHKAFHNVINPDLGAWNAVIVGYSQHDYGHSALEMFREMIKQCIEPDKITFSSIVKACTSIGAIETGKLVHNELLSQRLELDLIIGNSLIDMYARCGSLQEAHKILMKLSNRDIVSWNILISMYAQQGDCRLVQQYFYEMIKEGIKPDERTFMSILAACSHAGHVDEGRDFFISMVEDFGVIQGPEHFNCMIDLLGRVGKLKDAECFLASMPASPSSFTGWTSLLAACDKYSGTGIGRESFHRLSVIDPLCASGYVLMSNIYARIDKVRDVSKLHYSGKHD